MEWNGIKPRNSFLPPARMDWHCSLHSDRLLPPSPSRVRNDVEEHLVRFLVNLQRGQPLTIPVFPRRIENEKKSWRQLTSNSAARFSRMWHVLAFCHRILWECKRVTQREMFYALSDVFPHQRSLNTTLQECAVLLHVPKISLGITTSSRGSVAGPIRIRFEGGDWVELERYPVSGLPLGGDPTITFDVINSGAARYIIIVEKDAVFTRLAEDRVWERLPCVIVTARGFPDMVTRVFVHHLSEKMCLPVLGLADFNPHGLLVLLTYRCGSMRGCDESFDTLVDIKWLGLHAEDITSLPATSFEPFSVRDEQLARSLQSHPVVKMNPHYTIQVQAMQDSRRKAELESVYLFTEMGNWVATKILHRTFF